MNRRLIVGLSIGALIVAGLAYFWRFKGKFYSAPNTTPLTLNILPYNGQYKDSPAVQDWLKTFPQMSHQAAKTITAKTGLPEPPIVVNVTLDDSFESDPYRVPSAATQCMEQDYQPGQGNCATYGLRIGSKAIAEGYKGRTKPETLLTHELDHIFLMYYKPGYNRMPKWYIEGHPIAVAGQEEEIKRVQRENGSRAYGGYAPGEIKVEEYSELIDEFRRNT